MTAAPSQSARAARAYIDRYALRLVRIPPGMKYPTHDGWNAPGGWFETADEAEAFYQQNPSWGIGVVLGPSRLCSLDIDDMESAKIVCEEFGLDLDILSKMYPTVQGNPARLRVEFLAPADETLSRHALTWPRKDDPSKRFTVLELRAGDVQDVLPPSVHPDTGQPYRWITRPNGQFYEMPDALLAIWRNWAIFKPQAEALCPWSRPPEPRPAPRSVTIREGGSVIEAWIAQADLRSTLERYGYKRAGKRYVSPHSSTNLPGVVIHEDGRHCWIHHASDPLCTDESGARVNAFDLFCYYEHGGDASSAARAARVSLGMDRPAAPRQVPPPRQAPLADPPEGGEVKPAAAPILVPLDESGPLLPMPQIIRGVLPADAVGMVWGAPGSYKSFVTLDWSLCVASDTEWLGHPVNGGTVWYLAGEGQSGLRHRVQAWRQARKYTGPLRFYHSTRAILLDSDDGHSAGMLALLRLIEDAKAPDLIVVDTLSRSMAGDESATRDASRYVAALDELVAAVRKAGKRCTVVLVHHSRKDGDVYRGSSVLRGAADFEFEVESVAKLNVRMSCRKVKDGSSPDPYFLRLEPENLGIAADEFGVDVAMSSLAVWMDRAPTEREKADEKASELLRHVQAALRNYPDGLSQAALTATLHEAGAKFDKTFLPGFLALLAERGSLSISYGPRGAKVIKLANDLPESHPAKYPQTGSRRRAQEGG